MSLNPRPISDSTAGGDADDFTEIREIHALTSPQAPPSRGRGREPWEIGIHRSPSLSVGSEVENFTSMSREFNAMVVAGSNLQIDATAAEGANNLGRIGEDELEETNPLAIVPDTNPPFPSPRRPFSSPFSDEVSVHRVKKDEVNAKISAWQGAEIAKLNNRFKRVDVTINGWESEQIERATGLFKKIERKLEEKRARAMEKMQNDVAKAHRRAEDKRASAEAKRGVKVARVMEVANLLKAVGRAPSKRSFF